MNLKTFVTFVMLMICAPLWAANNPQIRKPNLELSTYRRTFTTDEPVSVRLSAYNETGVSISAYRFALGDVVPTSKVLGELGPRIAKIDLDRLPRVRTFPHGMGKTYPDSWMEHEVKVPKLAPGVYIISARGAGVEKRTWVMITDVALVSKRSLQELLVFAINARSGKPISHLALETLDARGRTTRGETDDTGVWRSAPPADTGSLWIHGNLGDQPASTIAGQQDAPDPHTIVTYTDRPIYRPGHKVQYKSIIRVREDGAVPGGFTYHPYSGKPVIVEIRDATDALISRKTLTTNKYGSLADSLQLASEPVLGNWQIVSIIGERRYYSAFSVEAYRKPEFTTDVTFDKPHYFNGDVAHAAIKAKYYYGQPVTGAKVHYDINFSSSARFGQDAGKGTEPDFSGDGETDKHGEVLITIPTKWLPVDRTVSISETVTDLSRRSLSASGGALIAAGKFTLDLSAGKSLYRPKDKAVVTVSTSDYDNRPVSAKVRVRLIETLYDRKHRPFEETTTRDVTTSAKGTGTVSFDLKRPGYLRLEATAYDSEDDKIVAENYLWVAGDDYPDYQYSTLSLLADKSEYRPGETATVMLNTNLVTPPGTPKPVLAKGEIAPIRYANAWALVTVEGERLYKHFVLPLNSRSTAFQIPLQDLHFPSVSVSAVIVQERHIYQSQARLAVRRDEPNLAVTVTPDREHYEPGNPATYTVTTKDWKGRPAPAEVSLGVVDASIYAIQPDNTPALRSVFYSGQDVHVETDFSFAAQYSGGAYQTVPAPAGSGTGGSVKLRRQFADTALWSPFVTTDATGTAKVSLDLPDNLTAWRATARGITLGTAVGETTHDVTSSLPLMARLSLPRFYVAGDKTVVSAIVQNATGESHTVTVHMDTEGIALDDPKDRTLTLDAGEQKRLDWPATVGTAASARIRIVADGGENARDAMESTLPVKADGLKMVEAQTDVLRGDSTAFTQPLDSLPKGAAVTLTLSPSIASSLLDTLKDLTAYPYGCAEQTMSGFLPDVIVAQTLNRMGDKRQVIPKLDQWVNLGIQKLYRYQHADGGWHWWEDDQSDPEMTSYVLWGLAEAKAAGYTVDDQRLTRGAEAVKRYLAEEKDGSTRAEYLIALAAVNAGDAAGPLKDLFSHRDRLDRYGKASLTLALQEAGGKLSPLAKQVAEELKDGMKRHSSLAWWPAAEGGYSWHADDVFVTAHCLRAVLAADPTWSEGPNVARWLLMERHGTSWDSTRTSAEAVYALSQYLSHSPEMHPNFTAAVKLDGAELKSLPVTSAGAASTTITLTPAQLTGHHNVSVSRTGDGVLYVTSQIDYTLPPSEAKPLDRGVAVQRQYTVTSDDPSQAGTVESGSEIAVTVDLKSDGDYPYVMLEEPIPAGCEVAPDDNRWSGSGYYFRKEVRDDRIVFFFDTLPKGPTTVTYRLHCETPGSYRILPGIAQLVYHPEVRGNTGLARTNIKE